MNNLDPEVAERPEDWWSTAALAARPGIGRASTTIVATLQAAGG